MQVSGFTFENAPRPLALLLLDLAAGESARLQLEFDVEYKALLVRLGTRGSGLDLQVVLLGDLEACSVPGLRSRRRTRELAREGTGLVVGAKPVLCASPDDIRPRLVVRAPITSPIRTGVSAAGSRLGMKTDETGGLHQSPGPIGVRADREGPGGDAHEAGRCGGLGDRMKRTGFLGSR
jgi:hypothetical protein